MTDQEIINGKSIIDIIESLAIETNFCMACKLAENFTRERIIWLLMKK